MWNLQLLIQNSKVQSFLQSTKEHKLIFWNYIIYPTCNLFILLSHEEVGCPLRWRLPLVSPSAAPQEELEKESKGRVSAPSGTITGMDPLSLEMVGRECVEEKIKRWKVSGRKCDRTVKQRRDGIGKGILHNIPYSPENRFSCSGLWRTSFGLIVSHNLIINVRYKLVGHLCLTIRWQGLYGWRTRSSTWCTLSGDKIHALTFFSYFFGNTVTLLKII